MLVLRWNVRKKELLNNESLKEKVGIEITEVFLSGRTDVFKI